jgi:gamma-glutamyltranspeptidase/glutathione hydrolase
MVCSVDHLASQAGVAILRAGGSAADAAIAASAVLAVTTQHMCGLGGDLFALVHTVGAAAPDALDASGRAGSGADADRLRAEGHALMPMYGDLRSVPVPGCVDGWLTLHARHGRLPLADVLEPARGYAERGFPASPTLARVAHTVAHLPGGSDFTGVSRPGDRIVRPGVARTLAAIAAEGRDGFYGGEFGEGLLALGAGEYTPADLQDPSADWVEPLSLGVWDRRVWTMPPASQGYLTLAASRIAEGLDLPADPDDPLWAHLMVESARQAAYDREAVLFEGADGTALIARDRLEARRAAIDPGRAADLGDSYRGGGTIYLCAVDSDRMGVSLIQSNANGFGAMVAEPSTGIFLQNRGLGFSLVPGHPAEYAARRRPPHTLAPALVTDQAGALEMVLGTMGGDSQPQVLQQLLARILRHGEPVGDAIAAPRWVLRHPDHPQGGTGFDTWSSGGKVAVHLEDGHPADWASGLTDRGHQVLSGPGGVGHAHAIVVRGDHLEGAADPRSLAGQAATY